MATIIPPFQPNAPYLPVVGYPKYIVTETGFVYDTDYRGTGYTRPCCHVLAGRTGYVKVSLATPDPAIRKMVSVHRLVAQAFIPPEEGKPDVNHIDLNKENNHKSNLEWIEHAENLHHARTLRGNWSRKRNPASIQPYRAYQYLDNVPTKGNFLNFPSLADACLHFQKKYKTFAPSIHRAMRRGGYAFGYLWEKT